MANRPSRHAIGLAVLVATPMASAQTNVTIYGHLSAAVESITRESAPDSSAVASQGASSQRLNSYGSFLGFKGTEDLGDGMKALFQIESYVFLDGVQPPNFNGFAARNGRVGLQGRWGTVFAGVWDTPMRMLLGRDPFPGTLFDGAQMLGNGLGNTVNNTQAQNSFVRRQVNTLAYWSPVWQGLQGQAHYSFGEDAVGAVKPRLLSMALLYDNGPLGLGSAYESHGDYGGGGTRDRAWLLHGSYAIGATRLGGFWMDQRYERALTTATGNLKARVWQVNVVHMLGNTALKAAYTRAGSGSGSLSALGTDANGRTTVNATQMIGQVTAGADTGAHQWVLGAEHSLSKRTSLHATLMVHQNERNGSFAPAGAPALAAGAVGVDSRALALGIRHLF